MGKTIGELLNTGIGNRIKKDKLALMCSQFCVILKSGINLHESAVIVEKQMKKSLLKDILRKVCRDMDGGCGLGEALERNGKGAFPVSFIETLKAGERAGNPASAFESLGTYYGEENKTAGKIKSALIYPAFVLVVAVVVLIVIMTVVMPKLTEVFESLEEDIPLITRILMGVSDFMADNIGFILIGLAALIAAAVLWTHTAGGRRLADKIILRLPVPGKILNKSYQADFAGTLCLLLESGISMTEALTITARVMNNSIFKSACIELKKKIESGRSLGQEMARQGCFDGVICSMVSIGEESGNLENMLEYSRNMCRDEADSMSKRLLAMLEPILLVSCAAFAGFIAFAIYIPLFSMYDMF